MLRHYEVNLAGPGHRARGVPCQDSCAVEALPSAAVAAVADGLGSQALSDVGSQAAARAAVTYCRAHLGRCTSEDATLDVLREAYRAAYDAVLDEADRRGESAGQMDCTLCVALFAGGMVAWGQSGDSGLAVAHTDGSYELVTRMQRDDEGRVYPLCFDERWEFGICTDVASALLCTDGVLEDLVAPPALAKHTTQPIDTRVARGFLHPDVAAAGSIEALQAAAEAYLDELPADVLDDDKTAVVLFDDEHLPGEMPAPYYDGPDWDDICAKAHELIYASAGSATAEPASSANEADAQEETSAPAASDAPRAEASPCGKIAQPRTGAPAAADAPQRKPTLPPVAPEESAFAPMAPLRASYTRLPRKKPTKRTPPKHRR